MHSAKNALKKAMTRICNYFDIPDEMKYSVLEQLLHIGFCPAYGKQKTMKREMEKSQTGELPQFLLCYYCLVREIIGIQLLPDMDVTLI